MRSEIFFNRLVGTDGPDGQDGRTGRTVRTAQTDGPNGRTEYSVRFNWDVEMQCTALLGHRHTVLFEEKTIKRYFGPKYLLSKLFSNPLTRSPERGISEHGRGSRK